MLVDGVVVDHVGVGACSGELNYVGMAVEYSVPSLFFV